MRRPSLAVTASRRTTSSAVHAPLAMAGRILMAAISGSRSWHADGGGGWSACCWSGGGGWSGGGESLAGSGSPAAPLSVGGKAAVFSRCGRLAARCAGGAPFASVAGASFAAVDLAVVSRRGGASGGRFGGCGIARSTGAERSDACFWRRLGTTCRAATSSTFVAVSGFAGGAALAARERAGRVACLAGRVACLGCLARATRARRGGAKRLCRVECISPNGEALRAWAGVALTASTIAAMTAMARASAVTGRGPTSVTRMRRLGQE
jgi:hypothetical protein